MSRIERSDSKLSYLVDTNTNYISDSTKPIYTCTYVLVVTVFPLTVVVFVFIIVPPPLLEELDETDENMVLKIESKVTQVLV